MATMMMVMMMMKDFTTICSYLAVIKIWYGHHMDA
jgi:hypothetical protein